MKKISVITPSFNQGLFLEQTIDSVLSQNYRNLEYIIIDGGSSDNSVEIIKKYEKHLHFWVSEKDKGQSHAINKGLKICSGEIVNWLNSDDYYTSNALHTVAGYFENNNILVLGGRSNIWKQNKILHESNGTDIYPSIEKTIGWARIDQPETFFRKSAVDRMGLLNEHLHYVMDREWWIRFLLLYGTAPVEKIDDILVNFRIHENSKTNTSTSAFLQETINVFYSISVFYNLEEAAILKQHFNGTIIEDCSYTKSIELLCVKKSIHYFLFQQAAISYAQNNYPLAKQYISVINLHYLYEADKKELEKISWRIKTLPVFIKKILNKNQ